MSLHLRDATQEDIPAIARICAAAFHPDTDAITRRLFPPHLKPENISDGEVAYSWRAARKAHSMESDRNIMMVAVDVDLDEVVGFALWESPIGSEDTVEAMRAYPEPPATLDLAAFAELRSLASADVTETFGDRGTKDVWHLDYLGVDPKHQRRGIGKMLVDWGVKRAAIEHRDCYLIATPAGRPLYLAFQFEDIRIIKFFGVPHHSMILRHS
ncbi:acyl-CoA N-acyltransferase [Dactylonectria macrodidyma]|uniref:Acyl-CoA N-acyltransferase n=1 Tax=Dactylonectria macrodidyma TaxID=307937 RepID=A0A9P9FFD8_9HYPO|nr:acyl-CoA N-acyltransferase [Dactylonectria macrodidyma]